MAIQHYAEWSRGFHERFASRRLPVSCSIEVTRRCTLSCLHCFNNLPVGDQDARRCEMNDEEHRLILDQLADAGCLWLLYTGGEIFARKDFMDIYAYAKGKGFLITLFTNGIMINEHTADRLAQMPPLSIEITLYGSTRETYERITRMPGSYDLCMRGIRLLTERKLPLRLKAVALTLNKQEIREMRAFAEEQGLEFRFDPLITPRIDCSRAPLEVRLSPREVVELDLHDPERSSEWKRFATECKNVVGCAGSLYACGGGINSFAIDPSGMLRLCVLSNSPSYDLRKGSFLEGWEGCLREAREKRVTRTTKCLSCSLKAMCGMCPANGELECKDPEEPVDFLCQVAHLRAYALGIPIQSHGDCAYCEGGSRFREMIQARESLNEGC